MEKRGADLVRDRSGVDVLVGPVGDATHDDRRRTSLLNQGGGEEGGDHPFGDELQVRGAEIDGEGLHGVRIAVAGGRGARKKAQAQGGSGGQRDGPAQPSYSSRAIVHRRHRSPFRISFSSAQSINPVSRLTRFMVIL